MDGPPFCCRLVCKQGRRARVKFIENVRKECEEFRLELVVIISDNANVMFPTKRGLQSVLGELCSTILRRKNDNKEESQAKPPSTNTCPRWAVR